MQHSICVHAQRGHTHFWHRDAGGVGAAANDDDGNDDDDDDSGGGGDDDDDDDGRAAHSAITTAAANVGIIAQSHQYLQIRNWRGATQSPPMSSSRVRSLENSLAIARDFAQAACVVSLGAASLLLSIEARSLPKRQQSLGSTEQNRTEPSDWHDSSTCCLCLI
jgi:hypothetical protein